MFESFGEDPFLTSALGVADIEGIQSTGAMALAKHFTAYSQETARARIDDEVTPRALAELYDAPFEAAGKDAHVAALTAEGVSGRESNVLHAATGGVPREYIARTRDYDEAAWRYHEQRLAERGLLNDDGSPTVAGRELKNRIESRTDALSLSALDALSDDEVETLFQALTPITRAMIAGGDLPAASPMNLRRNELHDESGHLVDHERG